MNATFHLTILSSEKKVFEGDLTSLIIPGRMGYMGVLANHAPLMTSIAPGPITLRDAKGHTTVIDNMNDGFLEVLHNKATVLICQEVS